MTVQLSQGYNVDSRYTAGKGASDNSAAKRFLQRYISRSRQIRDSVEDQQPENKFIMSGPGDTVYGFRNSFRASR
jgi:hypothetical protein